MDKKLIAQTILKKNLRPGRCFVGFDGFTDEILSAVDSRQDADHFTPFATIARFGKRITDSAGTSCNIELVTKQIKIGGNAPILTNALLKGGHKIVFAGAIGTPGNIEPLFEPMARLCEQVFPLAPSSHSDAIEFNDGKVILGKLGSMDDITWDNLLKQLSKTSLIKILDEADLFVSANWTMLPHLTEIWQKILVEIAPHLNRRNPFMFVDLADPAKRSDKDLYEAMETLGKLNAYFKVILGLNLAEAKRLCPLYQIEITDDIKKPAKSLREKLNITQVVVHTTHCAFCAEKDALWAVDSYFTDKPKLMTGAGDNFNAGYCNGLLHGLSAQESLLLAVATSGFYVKNGYSPSMQELADFL